MSCCWYICLYQLTQGSGGHTPITELLERVCSTHGVDTVTERRTGLMEVRACVCACMCMHACVRVWHNQSEQW